MWGLGYHPGDFPIDESGFQLITALWYCRNVKQYPEARQVEGLLLLRIDAPLYFANVNPVKDALAKYERRAQEAAEKQGQTLHFIIIDLSPVYDVDASAIHFFKVSACKA